MLPMYEKPIWKPDIKGRFIALQKNSNRSMKWSSRWSANVQSFGKPSLFFELSWDNPFPKMKL